MRMIELRCTSCAANMLVGEDRIGQTDRCPACGQLVEVIPLTPVAPAPVAAPPIDAPVRKPKPIVRASKSDKVGASRSPQRSEIASITDHLACLPVPAILGVFAAGGLVLAVCLSMLGNRIFSTSTTPEEIDQFIEVPNAGASVPQTASRDDTESDGAGRFSGSKVTRTSTTGSDTTFAKGAAHEMGETPTPGELGTRLPANNSVQEAQPLDVMRSDGARQVVPNDSPVDHGPLLKDDEYLILGEWSFGRDGLEGFPAVICFLEDGRAVFRQKRLESQGEPILGKYRFLDDGRIELKAELFRDGSWRPEYSFNYERLMLTDSDGSSMMFKRLPGDRLSLADSHPEIEHRAVGRWTNAEISLVDGLRTGLLDLRISAQQETAGDKRLRVHVRKADNAFPGRLSIRVDPGTPLLTGLRKVSGSKQLLAPIILASIVQTSQHATHELNRLLIDNDAGHIGNCLMTWYPFHASRTIPPSNASSLRFDDYMHRLKMSGLGPALSLRPLDQLHPSLTTAGHVLGAVWNESSVQQLQAKYTNLPATKADWPEVVDFVQRALRIQPAADAPTDLIGLWTGDPQTLEKFQTADLFKLKSTMAQIPTPLMTDARLLLQSDRRFTLIVPDPDGTAKSQQNGKGVIRFQGSWKRVGQTVICTPQYNEFERIVSTGRWPRIVRENTRFSLLVRGDELVFASPQGGLSPIALTRHLWFDGARPAPGSSPRPRPARIATDSETKPGQSPIVSPLPSGKSGLVRIAFTGDPAPGARAGDTLLDVSVPVINASGDVAFVGKVVTSEGRSRSTGTWRTHEGSLQPVLIGTVDAPQIAPKALLGVSFGSSVFGSEHWGRLVHLSDAGDVFVRGALRRLDNSRHGDNAIVRFDGQQVTAVTYDGMHFPGADEAEYLHDQRSDYLVTPDGHVSFPGGLRFQNGKEILGLWSGTPDRLQTVAMVGEPAPGTNGRFISSGMGRHLPIGYGQIAMTADFQPEGRATSSQNGVWFGSPGKMKLLVKQGDHLPGMVPNESVESLFVVATSGQGDVLLRIETTGGQLTNRMMSGHWLWSGGKFHFVCRVGARPPGSSSNFRMLRAFSPTFNTSGELVFVTRIETDSPSTQRIDTVWKWSTGKLELLFRSDRTADFPGNSQIAPMTGREILLNARGQLLLHVRINSRTYVGHALWLREPDGSIREIVREGEVFEFGPGQRRIVQEVSSPDRTAAWTGGRRCLNDRGQIAFRIGFDDATSGIYFKP